MSVKLLIGNAWQPLKNLFESCVLGGVGVDMCGGGGGGVYVYLFVCLFVCFVSCVYLSLAIIFRN